MSGFVSILKQAALGFGAAAVLLAAPAVHAQTTYTWTGDIDTDYQVAGNWSPSRGVPAIDDVLVFDSGITTSVTNMATQTIGELRVQNSTWVQLSSLTAAKTLTINGGISAEDLHVGAGSTLELTGNINTQIPLGASATGAIYGDVLFTATAASIVHNIRSGAADAIQFHSGSTASMAPTGAGAQNGVGGTSGTNGGIRFLSGSAYYQGGTKAGVRNGGTGTNPFGLTAPNSLVVFDSGSSYTTWDSIPAISGRTYGNFEWRNSVAQTVGGGGVWTVQNDLTVGPSGTVGQGNMNMTGQSGTITILGDLIVEPAGMIFNATPSPAGATYWNIGGDVDIQQADRFTAPTNANITIRHNGTSAQVANWAGKTLPNLEVANAAGLTLTDDVTVAGTLTGTAGEIDTGADTLTIGTSGANVGAIAGDAAIQGNLQRWVATSTGVTFFPLVDSASSTRTVVVNYTSAPSNAGTIRASFNSSDPGSTGLPLVDGSVNLDTVNAGGAWTLTDGNGLAGGTYDLSVETSGFAGLTTIDDPTGQNARIVKRGTSLDPWGLDGAAAANTLPIVNRTGLSGFSDFAVATGDTLSVDAWSLY